jgi:hypothetical protein
MVLAAGLGTRFGGAKQWQCLGPKKLMLFEYSLLDAQQAGFTQAVVVVNPQAPLRELAQRLNDTLGKHFQVCFVTQPTLPGWSKPCGTAHAVWTGYQAVGQRHWVMVINADDYYGPTAFTLAYQHVMHFQDGSHPPLGLVAYRLGKTLSEHGPVARGICTVDAQQNLVHIHEHLGLQRTAAGITDQQGQSFDPAKPVSLNAWVLAPEWRQFLDTQAQAFLQEAAHGPTQEWFLPQVIYRWMTTQTATVRVMHSPDTWCGLTYAQDCTATAACLTEILQEPQHVKPPKG